MRGYGFFALLAGMLGIFLYIVATKDRVPHVMPKPGHVTAEDDAGAEGGALEGDAKDKPAPVDFADGWTIGKPDIVVTMPKDIDVPASGAIEQSNVLVRAHFEKDVWVKAAEVKPGNPRVVHHMKAWVRPPDSPCARCRKAISAAARPEPTTCCSRRSRSA